MKATDYPLKCVAAGIMVAAKSGVQAIICVAVTLLLTGAAGGLITYIKWAKHGAAPYGLVDCWISDSDCAGDNGFDQMRYRHVISLAPRWSRSRPPVGPTPFIKGAEGSATAGVR
jgi:hypothetical protein